jgi:anti-anti-sigma factor
VSHALSITYGSFSNVPLLRLEGDLTFGQNVAELHDAVERLAVSGVGTVILDLTALGATDSTGIGALLDVKRLLGEKHGRVCLLRPPAALRNSLHVVRVTSMFVLVDDELELTRVLDETRREGGSPGDRRPQSESAE